MKRLLTLLTYLSVLFAISCSDDKSDINNNTTPPDTPPAPSEMLTVQALKDDNPLIYASGGSATINIDSNTQWQANITEPDNCDWLHLSPANGKLTLTTDGNATTGDREATVVITAGSLTKEFSIKQRQNIFRRNKISERKVFTQLDLYYDQNQFHRFIGVLPVPSSNIYQDIEELNTEGGTLLTAPDNETRYLRCILNNNSIPASGTAILREEFKVTNYSVDIDFDAITSYAEIDTESDIYKNYTGTAFDIIVPDFEPMQSVTTQLWQEANGNIVNYAMLCYLYVAENMQYLNPNTGLHPLAAIWENGGGDCGNQATVFISMLRNKGIPARHVVMVRPDDTAHVRAEFFLAGYGWIPVDPNAKNMIPEGDFFGKIYSDEIVMNRDIGIPIQDSENNDLIAGLLQVYAFWYWIYADMSLEIVRTIGTM